MSVPRAMMFLWAASARNRVLYQVRRLRQPKYLVGALVGGLYVYSLVLRRLGYQSDWEGAPPMSRLFGEFMLGAAMLGTLLSSWALGPDRPSLSFSQTEVQQLFPAPVSRRELLHFKLARNLVGAAVGALAATVFISRVLSPHPVLFFLGTVVTLTTVSLHVTAASFVRTRLARWGTSGTVVRWVSLVLVSALLIGAGMSALAAHPFPEEGWNPLMLRRWVLALSTSPALWPGRALVALPLAQDVGSFLWRLPLGLGLLLVHYLWVMRSAVPFEESAVGRAEERARLREQLAQRGGRPAPLRTGAPVFRLAPVGRPEVAILWKNLLAGRRMG
ncbi:MAG: putative ABC exporter domain-containing protein, partial [Cystobacter sp.]